MHYQLGLPLTIQLSFIIIDNPVSNNNPGRRHANVNVVKTTPMPSSNSTTPSRSRGTRGWWLFFFKKYWHLHITVQVDYFYLLLLFFTNLRSNCFHSSPNGFESWREGAKPSGPCSPSDTSTNRIMVPIKMIHGTDHDQLIVYRIQLI